MATCARFIRRSAISQDGTHHQSGPPPITVYEERPENPDLLAFFESGIRKTLISSNGYYPSYGKVTKLPAASHVFMAKLVAVQQRSIPCRKVTKL